jgi:hypothetical protein
MTDSLPTKDITAPITDNPLTTKRERKVVANTDETPDKHQSSRRWKDEMLDKSVTVTATDICRSLSGWRIRNFEKQFSGRIGFDHHMASHYDLAEYR